jgi:dethiobiotin synthetase
MATVNFITGTDTGAGKTYLTALLLAHLRQKGIHALAIKPFCSGSKDDVELLQGLQDREIADELVNPFYFEEPIAPLAAARKHGRAISLDSVLAKIAEVGARCDVLLIEGIGGVLVPLGDDYDVLKLIQKLNCRAMVAARNKLGAINHSLLTLRVLQNAGVRDIVLVLMGCEHGGVLATTNKRILQEFAASVDIILIPFLGEQKLGFEGVKANCRKIKKSLALLEQFVNFTPALSKKESAAASEELVDSRGSEK